MITLYSPDQKLTFPHQYVITFSHMFTLKSIDPILDYQSNNANDSNAFFLSNQRQSYCFARVIISMNGYQYYTKPFVLLIIAKSLLRV